jgi:hypothetical protein
MGNIYQARFIILLLLCSVIAGCSGEGSPDGNGSGSPGQASPQSGAATITGIVLSQNTASLNHGDTLTLTASLHYSDGSTVPITSAGDIVWGSADRRVLTVTRTNTAAGRITAVSRGQTTATADYQGYRASAAIKVIPAYQGVMIEPNSIWTPPEFSGAFTALARFSDGINENVSARATWAVADNNLATVSNAPGGQGLFTALRSGQTTITAAHRADAASATVNIMPIRLIGQGGLAFPPPNSHLSAPVVAIDGFGAATAGWSFQASGEVFAGGHDGSDWTPRTQINAGQDPADVVIQQLVAANGAGARLMVWPGNAGLYASYAHPGQSFGAAKTIPTTTISDFVNTFWGIKAIAVTSRGEALVLWNGGLFAYLSRYDAVADSWAQPLLLGEISVLRAAFNANGDAVLVWQFQDPNSNQYVLIASIYINGTGPGTGLQTAEPLYIRSGTGIFDLNASINGGRAAAVVWVAPANPGDIGNTAYTAQYSEQAGWHTKRALPMGAGSRADYVRVGMNASGDTLVTWVDTAQSYIYVNRFTPAGNWETAVAISSALGPGAPEVLALALAADGNAICIFWDGERFPQLPFKYRRYVAGLGWTSMNTLQDAGRLGNPNASLQAAYNENGRGIMAWNEETSITIEGTLHSVSYNFMELAPSINP